MNHPLSPVPLRWALLLAVLLGGAAAAEAQRVTGSPGVSVYRYAEPGQPTMDVRVWGAVRTPGVYQVERDTDLVELLTLAGGPLYDREIPNVERTVTVRISRGEAGRQVVFEAPLAALFAEATVPPALQPDDVISVDVEVRQRFGWRDGLAVFSGLGTVAVIVLNILRLSN
jgi:protein involved in polysaccharide export with SLBB domain